MTLQLSGLRAPEVSQQEKKSHFKNAYTSDAIFLVLAIEMLLIFRCGYKCMRGTSDTHFGDKAQQVHLQGYANRSTM